MKKFKQFRAEQQYITEVGPFASAMMAPRCAARSVGARPAAPTIAAITHSALRLAAASIAAADNSQEFALQYVTGILGKKKDALTDGASDGSQGTVAVEDGAITYTATQSKFVGNFGLNFFTFI